MAAESLLLIGGLWIYLRATRPLNAVGAAHWLDRMRERLSEEAPVRLHLTE